MQTHCTNNYLIQFRSYSHEQIIHTSNHRRSNSSHSVDLFTLVVPTNDGLSLPSLICSICSLPMIKPTLLPCQHTFCYKCIQNNQLIRPGSLPLLSTNNFVLNANQSKVITCQKCSRVHHVNSLNDLEENQSMELLINTLLCETCHQLYPSNLLDTCSYCYGVLCPKCYHKHIENHRNQLQTETNIHRIPSSDETINIKPTENNQISDGQIFQARSANIEKKVIIPSDKEIVKLVNTGYENVDPSQHNTKKKLTDIFRNMIHSNRRRQSTTSSFRESTPKSPSSVKKTSSVKTSRRPKMHININIEETPKTEPIQPIIPDTPVRRFLNLFEQYAHTAQHIKQCEQRQSELDRAVSKLVEVLTIKTKENINQIIQYWMYLKQMLSDQFQTKTNRFQVFDYLLKNCCSSFDSRKQVESYFEQNDEIKAALQVLSTTLVIVKNEHSFLAINQLFDREEQATTRTLFRQLDFLLSSYSDEISFITERIHVYQSRFAAWKNSNTTDLDSITYEWKQIVEHDYPTLIEKISNDFITKVPQIEEVLVQMLKNMKKRLLNANSQAPSIRTNDRL